MRLGLSIVIVTAVIFEGLRNQMHFTALVILGALLFVVTQTDKIQTQRLRKQTILDLATLITVMPVAILNGFVAAEPGSLLPAALALFSAYASAVGLQEVGINILNPEMVVIAGGVTRAGDHLFEPLRAPELGRETLLLLGQVPLQGLDCPCLLGKPGLAVAKSLLQQPVVLPKARMQRPLHAQGDDRTD
jgi:hypothetical protein